MNETKLQKDKRLTPAVAEDEAQFARVEEILKALTKLIHGKKLYAENNPRLGQFRDDLGAALRRYFKIEETLVLGVEQSEIQWNDRCVYCNERREDSIAFLLHKDGVGEISIGAAAVDAEMDMFVQILADEFHNIAPDEDVVTRFWNADFEHIGYRVLDDYLSSTSGTDPADADRAGAEGCTDHVELLPSLEDKGRIIVRAADPIESIDCYLRRLILRTCTTTEESEREAYFQNMIGSFFLVSSDEMEMYYDELSEEKKEDGLASFSENVMVFTMLPDNPSAVRDVTGVIERIVEFAIVEQDPRTLRRLLSMVIEYRSDPRRSEAAEETCAKLDGKLRDTVLVSSLAERLSERDGVSAEILRFLALVGRPAVDPMLKALHHAEGKRLHREMCDVLAEIASEDVQHVLERMDIDKPAIAADAVYLAAACRLSQLTPRLQELLYYPDRAVKEDAIALVSSIQDDAVVDLLLGVLSDEDKSIRCRAMEALAQRPVERVRARLSEIAFAKELADREADEQEIVFKCLGRCGDVETVAGIREFIDRKSFMGFGRNRENRFLAIRALEHIHHAEALKLLEELTTDANNLVQSRARRSADQVRNALKRNTEEVPK